MDKVTIKIEKLLLECKAILNPQLQIDLIDIDEVNVLLQQALDIIHSGLVED